MVIDQYAKVCKQIRSFVYPNLTNPQICEILRIIHAQNFDKVLVVNNVFKGFFNSEQVAPYFLNVGTDYETADVQTDFTFKDSEKDKNPNFLNTYFNGCFSYPFILRSVLKEDEITYKVSGENIVKGLGDQVTILSLSKLIIKFRSNVILEESYKPLTSFESDKEEVEEPRESVQEEVKEVVNDVKHNKWLILTGNNGTRTMILKEDVVRVNDLKKPDPHNLRNDINVKVVLRNGNEFYGKESFEQIYSSLS